MKTTLRAVLIVSALVSQATLWAPFISAHAEEKRSPAGSTPALQSAQKHFMLRILADQMVVPVVYRLSEGETAAFSVQLPYNGALAIHGYTRDMPVAANTVMTFDLAGTRTGRFPMHVHTTDGHHVEVGVLEVMPR